MFVFQPACIYPSVSVDITIYFIEMPHSVTIRNECSFLFTPVCGRSYGLGGRLCRQLCYGIAAGTHIPGESVSPLRLANTNTPFAVSLSYLKHLQESFAAKTPSPSCGNDLVD